MKIQVASDLHLEFFEQRFPDFRAVAQTDADVLVLAGDIHRHHHAVAAFRDWPSPVVLLNGNHEFYDSTPEDTCSALAKTAAASRNVKYLENRAWIHRGVRFLGCCLWTDYELYGDTDEAMDRAGRVLMDHRLITTRGAPFMPQDARALHAASREWLARELESPFDGATVVCTHHAPSPKSIHVMYDKDPVNPCFISDLSDLMKGVDLWIHGHVHNSFDYRHGATRVVANPRGYALNLRRAGSIDEIEWENKAFDPALVIEVRSQ